MTYSTIYKVIGGAFFLHTILFIILKLTDTITVFIDGGEWDGILDKLENITIGPLMLIIGIFAIISIFRMVERNKAWILTGFRFLCYGIDRTIMDLVRSFLEDKILIPFLNIRIGVPMLGIEATNKNMIPPNIFYWIFEFGDHYWTSLTLLLVFGTGMLYQGFYKQTIEKKKQDLRIRQKRFIETTSHELRTPLTNIKGFIEQLIYQDDTLSLENKK